MAHVPKLVKVLSTHPCEGRGEPKNSVNGDEDPAPSYELFVSDTKCVSRVPTGVSGDLRGHLFQWYRPTLRATPTSAVCETQGHY